MAKAPVALTSLSEEQRAEAYARFELLRSKSAERCSIRLQYQPQFHASKKRY